MPAETESVIDPIDTTIRIVTPENIAFYYRLAGPFRRLPAYIIDLIVMSLIVTGLVTLILVAAAYLGQPAPQGVAMIAYFFIYWGYGGAFEAIWNGQTPGKYAMGLRVVSTTGLPITAQQAVLRNILRAADTIFYLLIAALCFCSTRRFQRLGDLAADTMVIVEEGRQLHRLTVISGLERYAKQLEEIGERIPLGFKAEPALADALATYVARRVVLSPAQQREVAGHLAKPLMERWGVPESTNPDLLLCALYQRVFL